MKTIKTEEVYLFNYETILDVAQRIGRFIEEVYNEKTGPLFIELFHTERI